MYSSWRNHKIANFNRSFLEELKAKSNIVDVISRYVHLQKKGRDYWACCPFHHEKTASFQVREDQQFYNCFSCKKHGTVIDFLMEYEKMTFPEAIEWLAERAGMKIPEDADFSGNKIKKDLLEKIYNVNAEAAKFYYKSLFSESGEKALEYLHKRGITDQTIVKFGLGYSPDMSSTSKLLTGKGYDVSTLKSAGLIYLDKKNNRPCDFFAGRLIVPIIGANGKVLGFGGRVLQKTDFAKYKNTQASPAFNKSYILFALNLFKKLQQEQKVDSMILVEGYMDVISLYQAGIKNVVASMGTSLTIQQCRLIKRHSSLVYVCFDGDSAGQSATLRSLDMLKDNGLEVKVISIPDDMDPDDYVKRYKKEGFSELMQQALPLMEFRIKTVEDKYDLKVLDGRRKFINECLEFLKKLDDLEMEIYGKVIAAKGGISYETLISKINYDEEKQVAVNVEKDEKTSEMQHDEEFVLAALLNTEPYTNFNAIKREFFEDELSIRIYDYIDGFYKRGMKPVVGGISTDDTMSSLQEKMIKLVALCDSKEMVNSAGHYNMCYNRLFKKWKGRRLTELVAKLANEKDENKISQLQEEIKLLTNTQPNT